MGTTLESNIELDLLRESLIRFIEHTPSLNLKKALETLNLEYSRVYEWRKRHPEWSQRLDAALEKSKEAVVDAIEDNMLAFAKSPEPVGVSAGKFMLNAHKPKTYARKEATAPTVNNYSIIYVARDAPGEEPRQTAIDVTPERAALPAAESDPEADLEPW